MRIKANKYYDIIALSLCFFMAIYIIVPSYLSISVGVFYLSIERIAYIILLGIWGFGFLKTKGIAFHLKERLRHNKKIISFLTLFFLIQWVAVFFSMDMDYSIKVLMNNTLFTFLLLIIVISIPVKYKYYQFYGYTILYSSIFLVFVSLYELYTGNLIFENILKSSGNLTIYQENIFIDKIRSDSKRIQSTFNNPLIFGQYIIMAVPALLYFKSYLKQKWLINLTVIFLLSLSYFIKSRTLFISIILFILISFYYFFSETKSNSYKKIFLLLIGVVIAAFGVYVFSLFQFESFFDGKGLLTGTRRMTQLRLASELLSEWPIFGFGTGIGVQILDFGFGTGTIDNYFLTISLDSGFICLFLFLAFIITLGFKFFDLNTRNKILYASLILFTIFLITLSVKQAHTIFYFLLGIFLNNYADSKRGCWLIAK